MHRTACQAPAKLLLFRGGHNYTWDGRGFSCPLSTWQSQQSCRMNGRVWSSSDCQRAKLPQPYFDSDSRKQPYAPMNWVLIDKNTHTITKYYRQWCSCFKSSCISQLTPDRYSQFHWEILVQNISFLLQRDIQSILSWSKIMLNANSCSRIWQTAIQVYLITTKIT